MIVRIVTALTFIFLMSLRPAEAGERFRVDLVSSYDGEPTWSAVYLPDNLDPLEPAPLVIVCHGMGGNADHGIDAFEAAIDERGWLLAAPHTHGENSGGETSLGARAAQHDVMDLVRWMQDNHNVDDDRIYLTGGSMGGQQTCLNAAKYPDVFAAAFEWMGPTDLEQCFYELDGSLLFQEMADDAVIECGGTPSEVLYEYRRRSAVEYAMNLRTVPFRIGHGRTDILVLPHHARDLDRAIRNWGPQHYDGIYWHFGSHWFLPAHAQTTLDWFADKVRLPAPELLLLTTDEAQDLYYLEVTPDRPEEEFGRLRSEVLPATNGWDLLTLDLAAVRLRIGETPLVGSEDLVMDVRRLDPLTIGVDGITGTISAVLRNDEPYEDWSLDGDGVTIRTPGDERIRETYSIEID